MTGQEVFTQQLTARGEQELEVSNQQLAPGNYVYELTDDGAVVSSMKMIRAK